MNAFFHVVLVALGSALGGLARHGLGNFVTCVLGIAPHWGTLFINISGSLILGWFSTLLAEISTATEHSWLRAHSEQFRLLVAVGYTTFSSFEGDVFRLFRDDMGWSAIFYLTGSVLFGLVAFRFGMLIAGGK